jgi:hypothetical protein
VNVNVRNASGREKNMISPVVEEELVQVHCLTRLGCRMHHIGHLEHTELRYLGRVPPLTAPCDKETGLAIELIRPWVCTHLAVIPICGDARGHQGREPPLCVHNVHDPRIVESGMSKGGALVVVDH